MMTGPELTISKKKQFKSLPFVYNAFTHALCKKGVYTFISRIFNLPFSAVTFGFGPGVNVISLDVISGTFTS